MKNNRGFTVVESLIVIGILIIVILSCSLFVTSMLNNEHQKVFKTEVIRAMQAASSAYKLDLANKKASPNSKVCYPIEWLKENNILLLESKENYTGSILIESNQEGEIINYTAWVTSDSFYVGEATLSNLSIKGKAYDNGVITEKKDMQATTTCSNADGAILRK